MENFFIDCNSLADVKRLLRDSLSPKYGQREASEMARLILMHLKNWDLTRLVANEDNEAGDYIKAKCAEILQQLLEDVPIQYALGETLFYGLKLKVGPGVLIPRPETQQLVDIIVDENKKSDLKVLDLCTGSGAIAISLARNLPFSTVEALDFSSSALEYAAENAHILKTKIHLIRGDIFKTNFSPHEFDIIVSNPPYVCESEKKDMEPNVLNFEPTEALFVPDDDPLLFYRRIAQIGIETLKPGGRLYLEINPLHAAQLKRLLETTGYKEVSILKDIHGKDRFAKAKA